MMLRIAILALSTTLAAAPALAEVTSQPGTSSPSTQTDTPSQPVLLDGTDAMAQANQGNNDGTRNDMWLGVGMFAGMTGLVIGLASQRQSHATSP